ncbi:MAG TPA: hypothetical protein VFY90_11200 [Tepidiformaceae bacterium]|nr:hypothetical protein [Tepidiformaceae bacterium]
MVTGLLRTGFLLILVLVALGVPGNGDDAALRSPKARAVAGEVLRVHPSEILLRDGKTSESVRLELRSESGALLPLDGRQATFLSSDPSLVQVTQAGVVTSTGFGEAEITATLDGGTSATARVVAGRFRVLPPLLQLSIGQQSTGQLSVDARDAKGQPINLASYGLGFVGDTPVASVDSAGVVTALRPPVEFGETPCFFAVLDGVLSHNCSHVRVTADPLGLELVSYDESNVGFLIARSVGPFDYEQLFQSREVPDVTNAAYGILRELIGRAPSSGDTLFLVNDAGHDSDGTVPCGVSGNPVLLGSNVDPDWASCLIVASAPPEVQWFVILHEMGHIFIGSSAAFDTFMFSGDPARAFAYSEGLASAAALYTSRHILDGQIPAPTRGELSAGLERWLSGAALGEYIAQGADYASIDPDIITEILARIGDEYGWDSIFRFFSAFYSDQPLPPGLDSVERQATFFAAAVSAATRADLLSRFRDDWGFPIDETWYASILPNVERLAGLRDPAVYAGADRQVLTGSPVALNDAETFEWAGDEVQISWEVVAPAGGNLALVGRRLSNPIFCSDTAGTFELRATPSTAGRGGAPDTLTVTVTGAGGQGACPTKVVPGLAADH